MMGTYTSADVLCPFYEKDSPKTCSLICKGILPGSRIKILSGPKKHPTAGAEMLCRRVSGISLVLYSF